MRVRVALCRSSMTCPCDQWRRHEAIKMASSRIGVDCTTLTVHDPPTVGTSPTDVPSTSRNVSSERAASFVKMLVRNTGYCAVESKKCPRRQIPRDPFARDETPRPRTLREEQSPSPGTEPLGRRGSTEQHRQLDQTVHQGAFLPPEALGRNGETDIRVPGEQAEQSDLHDQPGQRGADAVMDPVPEGHPTYRVSVQIEPIRGPEVGIIPIGRAKGQEDQFPGRDDHVPQRYVIGAETETRRPDTAVVAHQLLHRRRHQ